MEAGSGEKGESEKQCTAKLSVGARAWALLPGFLFSIREQFA